MPSPVSLRDIATRCGCAISTVSAALTGRGAVAAATAERIRAVAGELGYIADPLRAHLAARRFRAPRRPTPLAFLRWGRQGTEYERHLRALLPAAGYACTVVDVDAACDLAGLRRRLLDAGVQGLIIHRRLALELPACTSADWSGLAVVVAATVGPECRYTSHDIGIHEQWLLAWRQVLAAGYRRIGAICLGRVPIGAEESLRLAACNQAQAHLPACCAQLPIQTGPSRPDREALRAWRARHQPDAIITNHDEIARLWPGMPLLLAAGSRPWRNRQLAQVGPEDVRRVREALALIDRLLRERVLGPVPFPQRLACAPSWQPGPSLPPA